MDFKEATDRLMAEGIGLEAVAGALDVAHQTVRSYRLSPESSGYRSPPEDWMRHLARFAADRGARLTHLGKELTEMLMVERPNLPVDWFFALVRIAGASFPVSASFVQLQSEIDTAQIKRRLKALEDPVSQIHPDVPAVGLWMYGRVKELDQAYIPEIPADVYDQYARPFAALHAAGLIKEQHVLASHRPVGLFILDPTFLLYLAVRTEDAARVGEVVSAVENAPPRQWLEGEELAERHEVPLPVVDAIFEIYERKGYGLTSKTMNASSYYPKV